MVGGRRTTGEGVGELEGLLQLGGLLHDRRTRPVTASRFAVVDGLCGVGHRRRAYRLSDGGFLRRVRGSGACSCTRWVWAVVAAARATTPRSIWSGVTDP